MLKSSVSRLVCILFPELEKLVTTLHGKAVYALLIEEIEAAIQAIMDEIHSPITTIPDIGCRMAAMILAEAGDFSRFHSPDKLLAYAGLSPSTYQSG